ncbi:uncharacterized protein [Acropora muricata]|uniref:uncharacterized protein isoform X2 n=1 Tax=Acropora muricata TaxID=159855 RepID=UPI0034E47E6A
MLYVCMGYEETRLSRVANTHLLKKHCYSRSIAFLYGWNLCAQLIMSAKRTYAKDISRDEYTPSDGQTWVLAYQQERVNSLKKFIQLSKVHRLESYLVFSLLLFFVQDFAEIRESLGVEIEVALFVIIVPQQLCGLGNIVQCNQKYSWVVGILFRDKGLNVGVVQRMIQSLTPCR